MDNFDFSTLISLENCNDRVIRGTVIIMAYSYIVINIQDFFFS